MALIGTLRNKMGAFVVIFVFVAIAAFTLNDLLGNNSVLLGNDDVGEIAGNTISREEYRAAIQERETAFRMYSRRAPSENDMSFIHQQAWELLISKYAIEKQYKELGIRVTNEEVEDMILGRNVDQNLKTTPIFQGENGEFDKNKVVQYLQYIAQLPDESPDKYQWNSFQDNLASGRIRIKYENLLIKTGYVTSAESEREYHLQNDVAEINYLFVPHYSIPDSSVNVSDSDLKEYYDKNKQRYETEHTADFSYVAFPVVPSAYDSADLREEMQKLAEDFKVATNDSLFAISNSDDPNAFARFTPNTLPAYVSPDSLEEGKVFGPFVDGNTYKVVKISKAGKDTIYTARARHILVAWTDSTAPAKSIARAKAEGILKEINEGADFAFKARTESEDPGSANQGGDLGWFQSGRMVPAFNDAVFGATKPGLINKLIETEFGYHIIDVTNTKDNTGYWIGVLQSEIHPSDASVNDALRNAESFQAAVSDEEEFRKKAEEEGLSILDAAAINTSDRRIGILNNARQIVQWIFTEASTGEVSRVFDLNEQFVVGVKTGEVDKGYKPFDQVKDEIMPTVRKEAKGRAIAEKLSKLTGTLDEIASAFGKDAVVYSNNDVRFNSVSLQGIANDPAIVGTIFSLESGKRSGVLTGENGVALVELGNKTIAPEIADYGLYKTQLEQNVKNQTTYSIAEAIKLKSDIEDDRYKFY